VNNSYPMQQSNDKERSTFLIPNLFIILDRKNGRNKLGRDLMEKSMLKSVSIIPISDYTSLCKGAALFPQNELYYHHYIKKNIKYFPKLAAAQRKTMSILKFFFFKWIY
jgi:hypothetical protein